MVIVTTVVALYYNMIIAWTIFYMFASMTAELPWERCHEGWSSKGKQTVPGRGVMRNGALKINKLHPGRGAMRSGAPKVNKLTVPWKRCH